MIDLNKLNPEQRAAVEQTEGPLLVLAGAGSGKTRVLTYRVALLLEKGVAPWKILAITFTNKAAREMQERVEALAGEACDDAWISTFHSACVRILRQCIERLGYKRSFTIYDESDCQTLIKNILKKMNVTEKEYTPKQVKFIISDAKNSALGPDEWLKQSEGTFRDKKLRDIYAEYEKTLKSNNALDFDDLLLKTLYLLTTDPELLRYWQNRFQYVLVDEFQDTNDVQYEIVHLLASEHRNLCIVGDDDQSIYGWRGANVENFFAFEKDFPECVTVKLERNYRSTGNILDAANQVIAHNAGRKEKMLWTEADAGDLITLYTAADERTEAAFICGRIQNLLREGTKPGEIAVLYRTNAQSRLIEEQLVRTRLPYRVFGGQKFYDRKEVKDLLGYLRLLVNNDDDISLRRVINEPKRGIGESTVDKLAEYAEECGMPMMTALFLTDAIDLGSRPKKLLAAFSELLLSLAADAENMSPAEVLDMVIERTGYVKALEAGKSEEDQSRIENIKELQGSVTQFTDTHPGATLSDYLENVALVTDLDSLNENGGTVTLMTIHAAKGLEFDHVFLPGMEDTIFPLSRAMEDPKGMEEERRLAYVALTRAKKRVVITHARSRLLFNSRSSNEISCFVKEIPRRLLAHDGDRAQTMRVPPPRSGGYGNYGSGYGSYKPRPAQPQGGGLNIPGVSRGFVPSKAAATVPKMQYSVGDRVIHKAFGVGKVLEVSEADRRLKVDFGTYGVKLMSADIPQMVKVGK